MVRLSKETRFSILLQGVTVASRMLAPAKFINKLLTLIVVGLPIGTISDFAKPAAPIDSIRVESNYQFYKNSYY